MMIIYVTAIPNGCFIELDRSSSMTIKSSPFTLMPKKGATLPKIYRFFTTSYLKAGSTVQGNKETSHIKFVFSFSLHFCIFQFYFINFLAFFMFT